MKPRVKSVEFVTEKVLEGSFLNLHKALCKLNYEDDTSSQYYDYEYLTRKGLDSVAIGLYKIVDGQILFGLIESVRTAAASRGVCEKFYLKEVVAGSLEPGEYVEHNDYRSIIRRVIEEVQEEAGIIITEKEVNIYPGYAYPSVGQSNERVYYASVDVTDLPVSTANGDGGLTEDTICPIQFIPIKDVIMACHYGRIQDMKTEILARRIQDIVFFQLAEIVDI
jgi:hypothetical protein